MTSRTEVEAQINARLKRTGIAETLTLPRTSDGCATPHVEGEAAPFDFVVAERGKELRRESGLDADGLAYLVIRSRLYSYVLKLEAGTRGQLGYSRKSWIDALIVMMGRADPAWGHRVAEEFEDILRLDLTEEEHRVARSLPLPAVD